MSAFLGCCTVGLNKAATFTGLALAYCPWAVLGVAVLDLYGSGPLGYAVRAHGIAHRPVPPFRPAPCFWS